MPRLAANLSLMFNEVPFAERFAAAARAGFKGAECQNPYLISPEEARRCLKDAKLEMALINAPAGDADNGERGFAALPGREADFRASLANALEYARALDCPCLHVMAGIVPADAAPATLRATYLGNLRYAAVAAATAGVTALIEAINPVDMPGYYLTRMSEARAILAEIAHPNLRLQFDFYHLQMTDGRLATTFEAALPDTAHIQITGVPGRHEPIPSEIDYPYLFALIDRLGYRGWVACEYRPAGDTVAGLTWARNYGIAPRN